ncbi:Uncharacterised protein [Achromobacter sp. 2789STDY5608633]|uniref:hypothetical protein n=1 Tax=Achromobacter sp. 2789STDY5608633 TaxID=1806501 RepID=UPI0006C08135|nr:hypothetical protein [Achromobacter sp. 2789STDY5608633]CUJ69118.1 Uncharacterised protein [Achromobacter sp. 2789STDY5608633]
MDKNPSRSLENNQEHAVAQLAASLIGYANTSVGQALPSIERLNVMAMNAKRLILAGRIVDWMMDLCTAVPDLRRANLYVVSSPEQGSDGAILYDFDLSVSCVESNSLSLLHDATVTEQATLWLLEEGTYPTFARDIVAVEPNEQSVLELQLCRDSLPGSSRETGVSMREYFEAFRTASPVLAHEIETGLLYGCETDHNKVHDRPRAA